MNKTKKLRAGNYKSLIFYIVLMIVPTVQFLVFYIGVNLNSFLLAFKYYDTTDSYKIDLIKNFAEWFTPKNTEMLWGYFKMSVLAFAVQLVVITPLGVLFAYYIFKKMPLAGFFRVMLFIPSIVSALVVLKVYKEFLGAAKINWLGSRATDAQIIFAVMLGNVLVGFGASVLMYANKMATIPPEVIESAQLDGATGFKEFIYIVFPMIYSTFSVFLISSIATLFTNQINNFALFGYNAGRTSTIGYYLFLQLERSNSRVYLLPSLSALGLMITAITVPITFLIRWLVTKFGPSED